jgi:hypothetical protein
MHPALGYPKPRETNYGQQGVVICDGVGTPIGYNVLMTALGLGIEVLLRVPNLSFALQGEDLVNFKELKAHWQIQKTKMATKLNVNLKSKKFTSLDFHRFMRCFKPLWDKAKLNP